MKNFFLSLLLLAMVVLRNLYAQEFQWEDESGVHQARLDKNLKSRDQNLILTKEIMVHVREDLSRDDVEAWAKKNKLSVIRKQDVPGKNIWLLKSHSANYNLNLISQRLKAKQKYKDNKKDEQDVDGVLYLVPNWLRRLSKK